MNRHIKYIVFVCSILATLCASPHAYARCQRQECGRKVSETQLLTCNAYREAISVGKGGMINVTRNVLTRVKSREFPNSIRGVIYQRAQYSWTAHPKTCVSPAGWALAKSAVAKALQDGPNGFLYYHRADVHPNWSNPRYSVCTGKTRFHGDPHVYFKNCTAKGSGHRKKNTKAKVHRNKWNRSNNVGDTKSST